MRKDKIKISAIVPVYNVEKYLSKAIESILNQSLRDFELYLVDDGSTDSSPKILDDYEKKDKRIIVIHQKNQGAFAARNNALKKAKGEYVMFLDSDDYIEKETFNDLYNIAIKYKSELVVSGFYIHTYYNDNDYITLNYVPVTTNNLDIENFSDKNLFRKNAYLNFDKNMFYPPWNKLYSLSYIKNNNISFPKTYRDDFPFVISTISDVNNITYTKKQYYHFIRKRSDSETQKFYPDLYYKREEEHNMMLDLYKKWGLEKDNASLEMIARRYIDRIIECMTNLYNSNCKLSEFNKKNEIRKYLLNKNFSDMIKIAKPKRTYLKIMYIPLILKNVELCCIMAKFINTVKRKNIALFSSLKTNR